MFSKTMVTAAALAACIAATGPLASADPLPAPVQTQRAAERVLVLPFTALHLSEEDAWISKSVVENVIATLDQSGTYATTLSASKVVIEDNQMAARNARQSNFPYALRGSIQVVDSQVRITALLIDSRNAQSVRTAIATGPVADLLKVEDDLTGQLLGRAPASGPIAAATAAAATVAAAPAAQPPIQIYIQNTPAAPGYTSPEPVNYNNPYYSPYALTGYNSPFFPGYYPGIIYISGGNNGGQWHGGHGGNGGNHWPGKGDGHGNGGGGQVIHFESSVPEPGGLATPGQAMNPGVPGPAMNPGSINSNPNYHPVYTRPPLPGTPAAGAGSTPIHARSLDGDNP